MKGQYKKELISLIDHLKKNKKNFIASAKIESDVIKYLEKNKFISFNTPIITHGMREYSIDTASITLPNKKNHKAFLRHSPQFEKQVITMSTKLKYFQKAPSVRPGDVDSTHVPYLNQLDIEVPYSFKKTKYEQAQKKLINILDKTICGGMRLSGLKVAPTIHMTYKEAMKNYGTDSPYIAPSNSYDVQLLVVKNPPLYQKYKKSWDTTILPMAQPIWENKKQEDMFKNNSIEDEEIEKIEVYGYDIILCSPLINAKKEEIKEGLEVGGGSVRVSDPEVQYTILKKVRSKYIKTFQPLVKTLEYFQEEDVFTAGAAIGLERLSMVVGKQHDINNIVPIPWKDGRPLFIE